MLHIACIYGHLHITRYLIERHNVVIDREGGIKSQRKTNGFRFIWYDSNFAGCINGPCDPRFISSQPTESPGLIQNKLQFYVSREAQITILTKLLVVRFFIGPVFAVP
jgi:hypothetical protein